MGVRGALNVRSAFGGCAQRLWWVCAAPLMGVRSAFDGCSVFDVRSAFDGCSVFDVRSAFDECAQRL